MNPLILQTDWTYLSCRMSGVKDLNYPLFNRVEKELRLKYGCIVLNPARNFGGDITRMRHEFMRTDIGSVLEADVVVFLEDWQLSRGARLEYDVAAQIGLKLLGRRASGELFTLPDNLLTSKIEL